MRYFISKSTMYDDEDVDSVYRDYLYVSNGQRLKSNKVRSNFVDVFNDVTSMRLEFGHYRHAAKAFYEALVICPQREDEIYHAQFGHSVETGSTMYARSQFSIKEFTKSRMAEFRECSIRWHSLLSYQISSSKRKRSESSFHPESGNSTETIVNNYQTYIFTPPQLIMLQNGGKRITTVIKDDIALMQRLRESLQRRFGFTDFKSSDQAKAVRFIASKNDRYLVILGTGGGKSLSYLLPASIETGLTAVVVPLKSLLSDALHKCSALNFNAQQWDGNEDISAVIKVDILFFTVEQATSWAGYQFLSGLKNAKLLNRIVVDEAHTVITWSGFREVMERVPLLRAINCQLVLLSATVPPDIEQELRILFGNFNVIKGPCVRPNIAYSVERSEDINLKLKDLCQSFLTTRRSSARMIIFSLSCQEANERAKDLTEVTDAVAVYTGRCSDDEREIVSRGFRNGTFLILSATSAFSMGVDYNAVDLVVHMNGYHSLVDFYQESGRAGRDGFKAHSIILLSNQLKDMKDATESSYLTSSTRCRRSILHSVVENDDIHCFDKSDYVQCDICSNSKESQTALLDENPFIVNYESKETSIESQRFSMTALSAEDSDPFSLTPATDVLSVIGIRSDPNFPNLMNAEMVKSSIYQAQDYVRDKLEEIRKAAFYCIYCRLIHNVEVRHRNGDLFHCDKQRKAWLCISCLQPGHKKVDCQVRDNVNVCSKCCLPANACNYAIHSNFNDYGTNCSIGIPHFLRPLCWLMFHDKQRRRQLVQLFKFPDNEKGYHEWLQIIPADGKGLANYCKVFDWAKSNKII